MLGGVFVVANAEVCRGLFQASWGVNGIHMSEDYFQLGGGGMELKLGRMIGDV